MKKWATMTALAAGFAASGPNKAQAGDWSIHLGARNRTPVRTQVVRVERPVEVDRVWIPAEYAEREVWQTLPPVVERRQVAIYSSYGDIAGYRWVEEIVEPTRRVRRIERVLVREGYYETVRRPALVHRTERIVHPRRPSGFGVTVGRHGFGFGVNGEVSLGFNYRDRDDDHRRNGRGIFRPEVRRNVARENVRPGHRR
jgi:hypothetical protein